MWSLVRLHSALLLILWLAIAVKSAEDDQEDELGASGARSFSVPMAEVLQVPIYLTQNGYGEVFVRASGKGSDFREKDYLTHADGVRVLNGGLDTFIQSGEKEVVVPVIDDEGDDEYGEGKLLGFVMLTSVVPRKLTARRGELAYDLEEGGKAPTLQVGNIVLSKSGAKNTGDSDYKPPPHGGGVCITSRDCYFGKGSCVAGSCQCEEPLTGSYCQLYRPDRSALSPLAKRDQEAAATKFHDAVNENRVELEKKAAARQRDQEAKAARRSQRSGEFGFAFGKGPPLTRPAPPAPKESKGLRHGLSSSGSNASSRDKDKSSPPPPPPSPPSAPIQSSKPAGTIEKGDSLRRGSILDAGTGTGTVSGTGAVPTLDDLKRQSQESREREKEEMGEGGLRGDGNNDSGDAKGGKAKAKVKVKTKAKVKSKPKPEPESTTESNNSDGDGESDEGRGKPEILVKLDKGELDMTDSRVRFKVDKAKREEEARLDRIAQKKRQEEEAKRARAGEEATERDRRAFEEDLKRIEQTTPDKRAGGIPKDAPQVPEASIEDLYGPGKAYPEPYPAGKVPPELVHARHKARVEGRQFIFSVRYRVGPLGLSFDNKPNDKTVVERVGKSMQSDLSDVRAGDRVLAVDQYNVSSAPAKMTQRIMSSLSWPRIVVYEVKSTGHAEKLAAIESLKRRSLNLTFVFPPTVVGTYEARTPEWTPELNPTFKADGDNSNTCPLFFAQSTADEFGCEVGEGGYEYALPWQVQLMIRQHLKETGRDWRSWQGSGSGSSSSSSGASASASVSVSLEGSPDTNDNDGGNHIETDTDAEREAEFDENSDYYSRFAEIFPMIAMTLQEASRTQISIDLHSLVMMKRGLCTFVTKSSKLFSNGAAVGLVINNEDSVEDMNRGKADDVSECHSPTALMGEEQGLLLHLSTMKDYQRGDYRGGDRINNPGAYHSPEVLALVGDDDSISAPCVRLRELLENTVDLWPHSVPKVSSQQLLSPEQKRTVTNHARPTSEEGGRLAVSGDNGWAFFDYHLAMFGAQEVVLGPHKMQMANPPHGCDPGAYTVRIRDSVVAILRGGGCSFGIKVINAQQLGAKAVIIVNTDDSKNMRLMALPDEEPMIQIPCVMVSRRFQHYVEKMRSFWANNQHMVNIQPTGLFGDYEERAVAVRPR